MIFYVMSNDVVPPCPLCQNPLHYRGQKKRVMKQEGGKKQWLVIRRFKCCSCHSLHKELPDCLVPYKHYQADIISGVLDGIVTPDDLDCEDYPCLDTMLLWIRWFNQNLKRIEGLLHKALYEVTGNKEELLYPHSSLLTRLRTHTPNWLEQVIHTIYNSGGFLVPVSR